MKTAYVVGYTGGFDWFFNAEDQEKVYQRTIEETKSIEDYHVIKFTYDYDENLEDDEVTDLIDVYFNSDEFQVEYPEWYIKDYLQPEIKSLEEENFDLRMKVKEYQKLLEYNNIEIPEIA